MKPQYTLVCRTCAKVVMRTRNARVPRPVRVGYCAAHTPVKRWESRNAPLEAK